MCRFLGLVYSQVVPVQVGPGGGPYLRLGKGQRAVHCIVAALYCIVRALHCIVTAQYFIVTALCCIVTALYCIVLYLSLIHISEPTRR